MNSSGHEGSLWMGDIADYMDENFIKSAFQAMDETVLTVKLIKNKYTGLYAGYCFVHFKDGATAVRVMHKLNGKMIPNSQPPARFMLNHSNAGKTGQEREFSLWVGDLDKSVDDSQLYQAFATRYSTVRAARVVTDKTSGVSRGYAFIRFGSEEEHKDALTHMNGFSGLANKPIRVSVAVPRKTTGAGTQMAAAPDGGAGGDYSAYYEQYWNNYNAWQNYGYYDGSGYQHGYGYDPTAAAAAAAAAAGGAAVPPAPAPAAANIAVTPVAAATTTPVAATTAATTAGVTTTQAATATPAATAAADDDDMVVEHDVPVDLERQNQEYVLRNEEFWDALDASRWLQPDGLNPALEMFIKT